jgi:HTH-type transcriptional regulator / antitoxin HigA
MNRLELAKIVIKPITNQKEFEEANATIGLLIDADLIEDSVARAQALALLEAITILASEYEKKHFPVPEIDPIDAIRERMEQLHLSQKDVAKYFGGDNRASEVLNRKRNLTLKMIKALFTNLNIPAETLLRNAS